MDRIKAGLLQLFSRPRAIFLCMAQSPRWRRAMHNIIRARWQTLGIQLTSHLIGDGRTDQNVVAFHFFSSLFLTYARFSLFVPFWLLFGFLPFFAMAPFQHNQFDKTLVTSSIPITWTPSTVRRSHKSQQRATRIKPGIFPGCGITLTVP